MAAFLALDAAALLAYNSVRQLTDEEDKRKPIALDLGPDLNRDGEIMPLIGFYRPQGIKVVAIEEKPVEAARLTAEFALMPDAFDVINDSYGKPDVLMRNGYPQCAISAFALWPDRFGVADLPAAISNLVCSGGYVQIVIENPFSYAALVSQLQGSVSISPIKNPVSLACINNPFMSSCTDYRSSSLGIPFHSGFAGNDPQYVITGIKR